MLFRFFQDLTMRRFLILTVCWVNAAYSVFHSLRFHRTSSCGDPNVPEYVEVGLVDKVPFIRFSCNSSKVEPKQAWMERFTADYPGYLKEESRRCRNDQLSSKNLMRSVQERLNQTGGVHITQVAYGCEWDDKTGEIRGHYQVAYDGEDFLSLDLRTLTWTARTPRADSYKQELDKETYNKYLHYYLTQRCPELLKKLLLYGNSSLLRTELPRVSLLQKTPSSPIVCHATGFYPAGAKLFWTKDGEELHDDVEVGEVLPNLDGTFQMRTQLYLSDRSADWGRYTCVFQLDISRNIKITPLTKEAILTNREPEDRTNIIAALTVHHVLMIIGIVLANAAFYVYKYIREGKLEDGPILITLSVAAYVLLSIAAVVRLFLSTRADLILSGTRSVAALIILLFITAAFAGVVRIRRSGKLLNPVAIAFLLWILTCVLTVSLTALCINEFAAGVLEMTGGEVLLQFIVITVIVIFFMVVAVVQVIKHRCRQKSRHILLHF